MTPSDDTPTQAAARAINPRLPRRVADNRLGIAPNPVVFESPRPKPRDVWRKWPRLRSARAARTLGGKGYVPVAPNLATDADMDALRAAVTDGQAPPTLRQRILRRLRAAVVWLG